MSFPYYHLVLLIKIWIFSHIGGTDCLLGNSFENSYKIISFVSPVKQINRKQLLDITKLVRPQQQHHHHHHPSHDLVVKRTICCMSDFQDNEFMIEAAASHTSSSYSLLGIKSLGIDYGLVRTGLAITVGYNPKPLAILSNLNTTQLCQEIVKRVQVESAQQIVVGLPLHKNGTIAEQTLLTRDFVQQLACSIYASYGPPDQDSESDDHDLFTAVPIYLWDERYTSKEAEARLRASNPKKNMGNLHGELDADAACIILEHFYSDNGKGAERVRVPQHDPALLRIVKQSWALQKEERIKAAEENQRRKMDGRQVNAKQLAIERAKILDAQLELQYGVRKSKRKNNKR